PNARETSLTAPVVFVGYGIDAAQYGLADYKGADVRGKIVAFLPGTPEGLGGEERAFFGSAVNKAALAAARGAVGAVQIDMPRANARQRPFATLRSEEHTSELQSRRDLVCRLLLEKKKKHHLIAHPA